MRLLVADRSLLWLSTTLLVLGVVQLLATKSSVALAVNPLPQPRGGAGIGIGMGGGSSSTTTKLISTTRGGSTATAFYKEAAGTITSTLEVASMAGSAELINGESEDDGEATNQNNSVSKI